MISNAPLIETDPEIAELIKKEKDRKEHSLELIASENCVSRAVLEAQGSILTDKYCEGYPGARYYCGCEYYDIIENLAIDRLNELFHTKFSNVQPHSGSGANMSVYMGLLKPGDTVLGPRLDQGGHLTHGSPVNFSGKLYKIVAYGVNPETEMFDADEIMKLAKEHRPKMIICGATAYSRQFDWQAFRRAADEVGAIVMADIAHYAGLIAGGSYQSPVEFADVVTSTTHKTLRGPRGGVVMSNKENLIKEINKCVFPAIQGGPIMHQIAAKAVAFKEAMTPEFKVYARNVVDNARGMAKGLINRGYKIVSGGTDSHVMVINLSSQGITGKEAVDALEKAGITTNKNTVPNDPNPPKVTSGVRVGTPAITSRGFKVADMDQVADCIDAAIKCRTNDTELKNVRDRVKQLCKKYPLFTW